MSSSLYSGVSGLALGAGLYRSVSGLWGGASGLINGFGGGGPYDGASLYLDFLSMTAPTFDSRITFSRGSNATVVDSTGRVTYAPANLLLRSQEFDNAAWVKSESTVTANAAVSPDGTADAEKLIPNAATISGRVVQTFTGSAGATYTLSLYAKQGELTNCRLYADDGGTNTASVAYNLSTGAVATAAAIAGGVWTGVSSTITSAGNGWWRITLTWTATSVAPTRVVYWCRDTGDGTSGIFIWGAQLEQVTYQTTPSAYVATTSAAYYGPRFDYDPVTLAPRGLLVEEARTNLLTYSEQFDNAAWIKSRSTITANATTSPDGTADADKLVEDTTASNTHQVAQIFSATSGTSYSFSVYLKAAERTWAFLQFSSNMFADVTARSAYINLSTGVVGTTAGSPTVAVTNAGGGWWRVTMTAAATATASPAANIYTATGDGGVSYTGDGTSGIYIWGAQLEAGSFATSYIPTTASTVTRSADNTIMTGTNFSGWYNQSEGTFVVGCSLTDATATAIKALAATSDGTSNNRIYAYVGTTGLPNGLVTTGGVVQANPTNSAISSGVTVKTALAYKTDDFALATNGGTVATDTSGSIPTVNRLDIGWFSASANYANGHIREIAYFNTRQSNARLQTLTAPPLVTTLSLDFTSGTYLVGY